MAIETLLIDAYGQAHPVPNEVFLEALLAKAQMDAYAPARVIAVDFNRALLLVDSDLDLRRASTASLDDPRGDED